MCKNIKLKNAIDQNVSKHTKKLKNDIISDHETLTCAWSEVGFLISFLTKSYQIDRFNSTITHIFISKR